MLESVGVRMASGEVGYCLSLGLPFREDLTGVMKVGDGCSLLVLLLAIHSLALVESLEPTIVETHAAPSNKFQLTGTPIWSPR